MTFTLNNNVTNLFPDFRLMLVLVRNADNDYTPALNSFVSNHFNQFIATYSNNHEGFFEHKNIVAWQQCYRQMKVNPKKKKPSSEALLTRTLKNNFIPHINAVVDLYLACETVHFFPLGGFDLSKIKGNIELTLSDGAKTFTGVGEPAAEPVPAGEVVYSDDEHVLTRFLNYRDSDTSKIDEHSRDMLFFVEAAVPAITDGEINETAILLANSCQQFFDAETKLIPVVGNGPVKIE